MTSDNENWAVKTNKRLLLLLQTSDAMTRQQHPNKENHSPPCDLLSHVSVDKGREQPLGLGGCGAKSLDLCSHFKGIAFLCECEHPKVNKWKMVRGPECCETLEVLGNPRRERVTVPAVHVKSGRFGAARVNSAQGCGASDDCLLEAFGCFNQQLLTRNRLRPTSLYRTTARRRNKVGHASKTPGKGTRRLFGRYEEIKPPQLAFFALKSFRNNKVIAKIIYWMMMIAVQLKTDLINLGKIVGSSLRFW